MLIGGEPFAHRGLERWLKHQSHKLYLTIYTNFSTRRFEGGWPENVHFLTSLDAACSDTYRTLRRRDLYTNTRDNLISNAKWIIHADTTVSKVNIKELPDILAITEPIGCSHWFLPVDPRIVRFRNHVISSGKAGFDPKRLTLLTDAASNLNAILLEEKDIAAIEDFYTGHRQSKRINTFAMFRGIYYASKRHFLDLDGYGQTLAADEVPPINETNCPGLSAYMEVTLDARGDFVPIVHCDMLCAKCENSQPPKFETFVELFEWESEARSTVRCNSFCGRTQFLGLDDYMKMFSEVRP